ncbi:MAG: hypothetical protein H6Q67_2172 [Firmicutes bacterium]|nr:hypothetical protein [Bacillota bacterium]
MAKVDILFSYPVTEVGKIIDWAEGTGEDPSHTGIFMLGGILEALDDGFVKSPLNAYDGFKTTILSVDLPNIEAAEKEAEKLLGKPYGWNACIDGGLHDLLGVTVPGDGEKTVDCSEAVTRILQAGGVDIFPDFTPDNVTPADLMRKLEPITVAVYKRKKDRG